MSGAHSRRKGARFERELVLLFRSLGYPARRNLQPQGGQEVGGDIEGLPWAVEATRRGPRITWAEIAKGKRAQGKRDEEMLAARDGRSPRPSLVIVRQDGDEAIVLLTLEDFLKIAKEDAEDE